MPERFSRIDPSIAALPASLAAQDPEQVADAVREKLHVRHACVAAGWSFLGLGLNQIILLFMHRIRPYDAGVSHMMISRSADWSFPSDHAMATFAISGDR